jgi:plastocyanin
MKAMLTRSIAGLALIILTAGCGGSSKPSSSRTATPAAGARTAVADANPPDIGKATITISGLRFGAPVTANPGEPIKVVNKDSVPHTVTSGTAFSVVVKAGGTATITAPTTPGTYPLTCHSHPKMHGTLTVRGI